MLLGSHVRFCKTLILNDHWESDIEVAELLFVISLASARMSGSTSRLSSLRVESLLLSNCKSRILVDSFQANRQAEAFAAHWITSNGTIRTFQFGARGALMPNDLMLTQDGGTSFATA